MTAIGEGLVWVIFGVVVSMGGMALVMFVHDARSDGVRSRGGSRPPGVAHGPGQTASPSPRRSPRCLP